VGDNVRRNHLPDFLVHFSIYLLRNQFILIVGNPSLTFIMGHSDPAPFFSIFQNFKMFPVQYLGNHFGMIFWMNPDGNNAQWANSILHLLVV
jgi:hypothetical protein